MTALDGVAAQLVLDGMPADWAAALALGVLTTVAEDPAGGSRFLDLLATSKR